MAKIRYFSDDEIRKFFDAVRKEKNVRDLLFFRLMYRYGLRLNEAVTIRLADVKPDIQHPLEIHIRRLKGGQDRHYPINPDDAKLLRRWLRKHETFDNSTGNPYMFITRRSMTSHMTDVLVKKLHKKYCELAGLAKEKWTNPHAWRHSCAISLLMSGKDIYFVKNYLGHADIKSTLVYAEIAPPEWKKLSKDAVNNSFSI